MNTKLLTNTGISFETIFPKTKKKKKTTDLNQLSQTCQFQQFHETYLAKNHSCILSNPLILKYWNWSNSWMKYIILETPNRRWRYTIRRNLNYLSLVSIRKRERGVRKRRNWGIFRYFRVQTSLANQSIEDCEESRKHGNVSRAQILITRGGEEEAFIGDKLPRSRTLMSFSTRPLSHNEKKLVCSKVRGPMGKLF